MLQLPRTLNSLGLIGISALLTMAFADQFTHDDLPCPLCLLQRAGFGVAAFGLVLNVIFGARPSHYAITLLGALGGAAVSVRQIFLHIEPGSGSYGGAFFGIHLYSWAFITFFVIILGVAGLLLWDRQFAEPAARFERPRGLALLAVGWFALLMLTNGLSTFAECTIGLCPESPTGYLLFQ